MNRRRFITKIFSSGLAVGTASLIHAANGFKVTTPARGQAVKIVPIEGVTYPTGFLKFIAKEEFPSPRSAIMAVRNQDLPYILKPLSNLP